MIYRFVGFVFAKFGFQVEILVQDLTNTGFGVGRDGQWVVFVPFVLPGELIRARIIRNYKGYSEAELVAVVEPSRDRVMPECKVATLLNRIVACSKCHETTVSDGYLLGLGF